MTYNQIQSIFEAAWIRMDLWSFDLWSLGSKCSEPDCPSHRGSHCIGTKHPLYCDSDEHSDSGFQAVKVDSFGIWDQGLRNILSSFNSWIRVGRNRFSAHAWSWQWYLPQWYHSRGITLYLCDNKDFHCETKTSIVKIKKLLLRRRHVTVWREVCGWLLPVF